jgi:hypothetical protein
MATLLITVDAPQQSIDLEVPGDVQISELLPALILACGLAPVDAATSSTQWMLSPIGGNPFSPNRSLIACGVVDGARLVLQDSSSPRRTPEYHAVKPTFI